MNLRRYHRYRICFFGKWSVCSGALLGLSVFLRILYYFVFTDVPIMDRGMMQIVMNLGIPILLCTVYVLLLVCFRLDAPGVYGIIGSLMCIYLICVNALSGNIFRTAISVPSYLAVAVVLLGTVGGYLPGRFIALIAVAVLLTLRIMLFDLGGLSWQAWLQEGSDLTMIGALLCLPMSLYAVKKKKIKAQLQAVQ